jgi:hypothetical protein
VHVGGWVGLTFQTISLDRVNTCNQQTNIANLCLQTADDLEPLLENMETAKGAVSTQTLVSSDGQQQKAAKLPQYAAAVSGNVGENNFADITWLKIQWFELKACFIYSSYNS